MIHAWNRRIAHRWACDAIRTLRTPARLTVASALLLVTIGACAGRESPQSPAAQTLALSHSATVGDLSLVLRSAHGLVALYTDSATSSLVLTELDLAPQEDPSCAVQPGSTTYFERTTDSAEAGAATARHVLLTRPDRMDLLYHDLQSDGNGLTKWVHRASADTDWWIDLLPFSGLLLAAVPEAAGGLRLVYQLQQTLFVSRPSSPQEPTVLLRPFDAASRGQPVDSDPAGGFTLYDRLSRRLYLVGETADGLAARPVHAGGQVHYGRLLDGRHSFLLYDRPKATVLALEEGPSPGQYRSYRVTLSEQTTVLFFADFGGSRFYLFDEYDPTAPQDRRYSLAILYGLRPGDASPPAPFRKVVLAAGARPLRACRVVQHQNCLVLLCAWDSLSLITVSLSAPPFGSGGG